MPMLPAAPALFSTITGWPHFPESFCPTRRGTRSATPPAAKGTMMRTGFVGQASSADAPPAKAARRGRTRKRNSSDRRFIDEPVSFEEGGKEFHPEGDHDQGADAAEHHGAYRPHERRRRARAELAQLVARADERRIHGAHAPAHLVGRLDLHERLPHHH